jgi:hypothetical protein
MRCGKCRLTVHISARTLAVSTRARNVDLGTSPTRPRPSTLCLPARCMCLLGDILLVDDLLFDTVGP